MRTGTCNFPTIFAAMDYYRGYGFARSSVQAKVDAGEIEIGKPKLKEGQKLVLIDNGKRYAIEEATA